MPTHRLSLGVFIVIIFNFYSQVTEEKKQLLFAKFFHDLCCVFDTIDVVSNFDVFIGSM